MTCFSPHPIARFRRRLGTATPKGRANWGIRPTINLSTGFFNSLSLERTQPQRDIMYDVEMLRR